MSYSCDGDRNGEQGFTLVELAIVLMIIGLLIGGIIRGREILENAQVVAIIQQAKGYEAARNSFYETYNSLPGDMVNATSRLPNCNGTYRCDNGDGNEVVGQPLLDHSFNVNQAGTTSLPDGETSYFWKHLALAHLISGVDPSADVTQPEWGRTHPAAKIGGGFTIFFMRATGSGASGDKGRGHSLRLQGGPRSTGMDDMSILTPLQAWKIDTKMDDGLGDSGSVTGDHEWNCDRDSDGSYRVDVRAGEDAFYDQKTCFLYFNIDGT